MKYCILKLVFFLSIVVAATANLAAQTPSAGWTASLSNEAHNVSGSVTVVDHDTLSVDNFTYDGGGIVVFFYLGTSDTNAAFNAGLSIGDDLLGMSFDGTQPAFTIDLPAGSTVDGYHAISVWCVAAGVSFGSGTFEAVIRGDFDGNGLYECDDVDGLVAEIAAGTNAVSFDLTSDGLVNDDDLTAWLAEAGSIGGLTTSGSPVLRGDANLDGTVNGADFLAWNANKFSSTPSWCAGDFDASGTVDGNDFLIWNANKFTSADEVSAVPEPSELALLGVAIAFASFLAPRK